MAPGEHPQLTLVFEGGRVRVTDPTGKDARGQLFGRFYVRQLAKRQPEFKEWFGKFGDVFWYDQYRNLGQAVAVPANGDDDDVTRSESWLVGVEQLRRFLQDWWTYHVSGFKTSGRDFIPELESLLAKVFPETRFRGPQPVDSSGAETAPNELELHLHPPEQQALLAALPKMGPDCQFILTTHSSFVEGSIPNEQETRLREGRLPSSPVDSRSGADQAAPVPAFGNRATGLCG